MPKNQLKVVGVQVRHPTAEARTAGGIESWLDLSVEVENPTTASLHVWASPSGYDYDPATKVLTLHMSQQPLVVPPGIIMLSDHPVMPDQIEVAAKSTAKIRVRFPAHIRRAAAPGGAGGWSEVPIGEIAKVAVDVQFAPTPAGPPQAHEGGPEFRARLTAHGDVVHAQIPPTEGGAAKN
jgi:hypothetical protein